MTHAVRVLRRAQRDLQEIYDHIVREAPMRAGPFIDKLIAAIETLFSMPDRGTIPRDPILAARGYRFIVQDPYLIFYKVKGREARVHRVLRGSRAYRDLL